MGAPYLAPAPSERQVPPGRTGATPGWDALEGVHAGRHELQPGADHQVGHGAGHEDLVRAAPSRRCAWRSRRPARPRRRFAARPRRCGARRAPRGRGRAPRPATPPRNARPGPDRRSWPGHRRPSSSPARRGTARPGCPRPGRARPRALATVGRPPPRREPSKPTMSVNITVASTRLGSTWRAPVRNSSISPMMASPSPM